MGPAKPYLQDNNYGEHDQVNVFIQVCAFWLLWEISLTLCRGFGCKLEIATIIHSKNNVLLETDWLTADLSRLQFWGSRWRSTNPKDSNCDFGAPSSGVDPPK